MSPTTTGLALRSVSLGRASFRIIKRLPDRATPPIILFLLGSYLIVGPPRTKLPMRRRGILHDRSDRPVCISLAK